MIYINKNIIYAFGVILIVGVIFLISGQSNSNDQILVFNATSPYIVPKTAIHWHPLLKITTNGKEQFIPENIGVNIGNILDSYLGGGMSPLHTHSGANDYNSDGRVLHLENSNPSKKPETLTLGYFFKVWGKTFNSTCILDKCNSANQTVKMFVNGKQNYDYQNYFLRQNDKVEIKFE
ncbi:MAG: hypothetical protein AABX38_04260 [Candidatus Micrarchaeota archaeon]